jgi:hypothetical protein
MLTLIAADTKDEKFMIFEGLSDESEAQDGDDISVNHNEGVAGNETRAGEI